METTRVRSFRDLDIWKRSMQLARLTYSITDSFPKREWYGLADQMRRASISIPSNIAEGQQRHSRKEFVQFLFVARGSLAELWTQCSIAADLGYIENEQCQAILAEIDELMRMTYSLIQRFKGK